jgi:hypothetical protein
MKARLKTPETLVDVFVWTPETAKVEDCVAIEAVPNPAPGQPTHRGTVQSKRGQLIVNPGDYVLTFARDEQGMPDYDVKNPKDFAEQYEVVSEAKAAKTADAPHAKH